MHHAHCFHFNVPILGDRTDRGAPNYCLLSIDLGNPQEENWSTLIGEHDRNVLEWAACVSKDRLVTSYMVDVKNALKVNKLIGRYRPTVAYTESLFKTSNIPTLCCLGRILERVSAHQPTEHVKTNSYIRYIRQTWGVGGPYLSLSRLIYIAVFFMKGVRSVDGAVPVRLPPRHRLRGGVLGREETLGTLLQVQLDDNSRHHLQGRHGQGRPAKGRTLSGMIWNILLIQQLPP